MRFEQRLRGGNLEIVGYHDYAGVADDEARKWPEIVAMLPLGGGPARTDVALIIVTALNTRFARRSHPASPPLAASVSVEQSRPAPSLAPGEGAATPGATPNS